METITAYPLTWPTAWQRTPKNKITRSRAAANRTRPAARNIPQAVGPLAKRERPGITPMKLTEIATHMKQKARGAPGEIVTERLPRGAQPEKQVRVHLKCVGALVGSASAEAPEFHLQIQRVGSAPKAGTLQMQKWRQELATFARDFGVPPDAKWLQQIGESTYAAALCWKTENAIAPSSARVEPEIDPQNTEIIGVLPKPIRIPSVRGDRP